VGRVEENEFRLRKARKVPKRGLCGGKKKAGPAAERKKSEGKMKIRPAVPFWFEEFE